MYMHIYIHVYIYIYIYTHIKRNVIINFVHCSQGNLHYLNNTKGSLKLQMHFHITQNATVMQNYQKIYICYLKDFHCLKIEIYSTGDVLSEK